MKNKLIKSVSLILALVLIFLLASCGKKESTSSGTSSDKAPERKTVSKDTPPSWKGVNSEFTIDWYVNLPWWKWNGVQGQDMVSKIISEKTGAKFNFIIPASDGNEQLSTMIAANNLPDVVTIESWSDLRSKLARGGYLWPLNDLINEHAPTFWNTIHNDIFNWFQEFDGKTYGLPNYAYSSDNISSDKKLEPNGCIVVRQDLYNALGKPDMSTPDKFLAACQRVKDEIKTYNGKQITPIQLYEFTSTGNTSLTWLSQYFATPYEDADGKFIYDKLNDNYWQSIKFLNEGYRKGLISEANFSDTRDMINERIARGSAFAIISAPQDFSGAFLSLYNKDNNAKYIPVVLKNYKNEEPVLQDIRGQGWMINLISKKADNPDRIIKLFEYLSSMEGQMDISFGKEGETYTWNADKTKLLWTDAYKKSVDSGTSNQYGLNSMNLLSNYAAVMDITPDPERPEDKYIKYLKEPMKKYSFDFSAKFLRSDPFDSRTNSIKDKQTKIDYYWGKQLPKILTAQSEQESRAAYDETVAGMKSKGLDEVIVYMNDSFQNAKKTLGIERSWPPLINK